MALANLIEQALMAPSIFHYENVLNHPNVIALAERTDVPDVHKLINTLKLFTYGCFEDYIAEQNKVNLLSLEQIEKLRLLSLMSIATKNNRIKYDFLTEKLGLPPAAYQKLEEIIMSAMCQGAIQGQMDQEHELLLVQGVQGRDVRPEEIPHLSQKASEWCESMEKVLKEAFAEEKAAKEAAENEAASEKRFQEEIQSIKKAVKMDVEERRENSEAPVEMRPKKSKMRIRKN